MSDRIRGVPVVDRARTTTRRPDGCLSGLDQLGDADHQGRNTMTITAIREALVGSGEHICAVLQLGDDYTNAEYISAVSAAREAGVGEAYASKVLGVDGALVRGVEHSGDATVRAVEDYLRHRGIDPVKATYQEYAGALVEVGS